MIKLQAVYSFLSRLSKRERFILYGALFCVMVAFLDRLIINPVFSKMKTLDEAIEGKKIALSRDLRILTQKERILTESAKYDSYPGKFKSQEEEMSFFLKEIGSLADKNSVYVLDLKPRAIKNEGSSKKYLINLSCEAQMEQIAKFMYDIESMNRPVTIENYQIGPKSKNSSLATCNIIISKIIMF